MEHSTRLLSEPPESLWSRVRPANVRRGVSLFLDGADLVSGYLVNAFGIEGLAGADAKSQFDAAAGQDEKLKEESSAFHDFQLRVFGPEARYFGMLSNGLRQRNDQRAGMLGQRIL